MAAARSGIGTGITRDAQSLASVREATTAHATAGTTLGEAPTQEQEPNRRTHVTHQYSGATMRTRPRFRGEDVGADANNCSTVHGVKDAGTTADALMAIGGTVTAHGTGMKKLQG